MDRLEDIRKILELVKTNECSVGRATHQICFLFGPKPGESRLVGNDELRELLKDWAASPLSYSFDELL